MIFVSLLTFKEIKHNGKGKEIGFYTFAESVLQSQYYFFIVSFFQHK